MLHQLLLTATLALFSLGSSVQVEKTYTRLYSQDGMLEAEGWSIGTAKIDYWVYYHPNGSIAKKGSFRNNVLHGYWHYFKDNGKPIKEGHYRDGKAEKWWIYYNEKLSQTEKYQCVNGQKNGYCFYYRNKKLFKAERYEADKKTNEWTNLASFIRDNPNPSF